MRRFLIALISLLLTPCIAVAQPYYSSAPGMGTTEQDGNPDVQCITYVFDNGTVTDNGDGTCDVTSGVAGAPADADYLVGTANGSLSNEIVVGATPGGSLGGTWASPTVDSDGTWTLHNDYPAACGANNFATAIGDTLTCAQPDFTDLSGTATDAQIPNNITIDLAATATALAANPTDCGANEFAQSIVSSGNLTCAAITDADVPNNITIDLAATATALAANPTDCAGGQFANAIDASGNLTCAATAGGSTVTEDINQSTHGFAVGNVLYHNGTIYALADADAASTAESIGIVSAVAGVDDFTLQTEGRMTGLSGLTAGEAHFLSTTAGAITATAPSGTGDIVKPILIADSTTSGYVVNMRGTEVGATSEVNALESDGAQGIADTEIFIGTGADTGNYAAMSGGATMTNAGVVTVVTNANLTGPITSVGNATSVAASVGGRSLTVTANVLDADAELYTQEKGAWIDQPVVEDIDEIFFFMNAVTITRVQCFTDTGTATLNIENATDTDILSTDIVCDASQSSCASGCDVNTIQGAQDNFAAFTDGNISISATSGTPGKVSVFIGYTIDD